MNGYKSEVPENGTLHELGASQVLNWSDGSSLVGVSGECLCGVLNCRCDFEPKA